MTGMRTAQSNASSPMETASSSNEGYGETNTSLHVESQLIELGETMNLNDTVVVETREYEMNDESKIYSPTPAESTTSHSLSTVSEPPGTLNYSDMKYSDMNYDSLNHGTMNRAVPNKNHSSQKDPISQYSVPLTPIATGAGHQDHSAPQIRGALSSGQPNYIDDKRLARYTRRKEEKQAAEAAATMKKHHNISDFVSYSSLGAASFVRERADTLWADVAPTLLAAPIEKPESVSYWEKRTSGKPWNKKPQSVSSSQDFVIPPYVRLLPSEAYSSIYICDEETLSSVKMIVKCLGLRAKFSRTFPDIDSPVVWLPPPLSERTNLRDLSTEPLFSLSKTRALPKITATVGMINGVAYVRMAEGEGADTIPAIRSIEEFLSALNCVMLAVQNPACKSFCYRRLRYLREKFSMHLMFNGQAEAIETQENPHRDFYNVRKVDTHVHHSACMRQKHLLRFIRSKCRREPDAIVKVDGDNEISLSGLLTDAVGCSAHELSVDLLNVSALGSCFQRFDVFNTKYNPFGQQDLREVFLKTDNHIGGRYLAEITKEVMDDLESSKYQLAEWRISIHGKSYDEWQKLGRWFREHGIEKKQIRWIIQVPRLYSVFRSKGLIRSFGEMMKNIFLPVFEAVIHPEAHWDIFRLLHHVVGWDSVDDESVMSKFTTEGLKTLPLPDEWTTSADPPYSYWAYYMYANIRVLNELLVKRNMRTMPFRPHCGEAGNFSHLATMLLLADGINHGILLAKVPVLQYLYYLEQIGLAISPLSNNALFHEITKNPFFKFFKTGLNVSLSTDDPLMFHFTDEPLLEEYSCCTHVWKLAPVDLCEIARNSVYQSNFEPQFKRHWLGNNYHLRGFAGNDISKTNVSNIRVQYREDTLREEFQMLKDFLLSNEEETHLETDHGS